MPIKTLPPTAAGSNDLAPDDSQLQSAHTKRPKLPPGPRTPAIINMLRYAFRPYDAMLNRSDYGDCSTSRMLGQPPIVSFSDPQAIKEIFAGDPDVLYSGEALSDTLGPLIGWNSLLVLDG